MGWMFCKWSVELGLSPLSFTVSSEGSKGTMEIRSFPLASLTMWPLFTQTAALQDPLPTPPQNPVPTTLPPSLPSLPRHLLLTTACPIGSGVQLRATKAFHWAPQSLADILENKCETVLFAFSKLAQKHFYNDGELYTQVTHKLKTYGCQWGRVIESGRWRTLNSNLIRILLSFINSGMVYLAIRKQKIKHIS